MERIIFPQFERNIFCPICDYLADKAGHVPTVVQRSESLVSDGSGDDAWKISDDDLSDAEDSEEVRTHLLQRWHLSHTAAM